MDRNYDVITFTSKYRYFKKTWGSHFFGIIKIATNFIKVIFKESRKVKRISNYLSKCDLYLYFLIYQNLLIPSEKMLMSAELRECVT